MVRIGKFKPTLQYGGVYPSTGLSPLSAMLGPLKVIYVSTAWSPATANAVCTVTTGLSGVAFGLCSDGFAISATSGGIVVFSPGGSALAGWVRATVEALLFGW